MRGSVGRDLEDSPWVTAVGYFPRRDRARPWGRFILVSAQMGEKDKEQPTGSQRSWFES